MPTSAKKITNKIGSVAASVLLAIAVITAAHASFGLETNFVSEGPLFRLHLVDPESHLGGRQALFISNLNAAVEAWNRAIPFRVALNIEVRLEKTKEGRLAAASQTNRWVGKSGERDIFEEGAAYKLRTGQTAKPGAADIIISINPDYLNQEVWFDPNPKSRTNRIPTRRVDLVSLLEHELAHAIGFHSFRDLHTGSLPKGYMSAFDRWVVARDGRFFFVGPESQKVYGGPVPITSRIESQNFMHYGNPGDPSSLLSGLMNGVTFHYQERYEIGALDVAILKDLGLPAISLKKKSRVRVHVG